MSLGAKVLASDPGIRNVRIFNNTVLVEGVLDDHRAEGELWGLREAVLEVLSVRGFEVEDDLRTALANSGAPAALRAVLRRAAVASSTAEVLAALQG